MSLKNILKKSAATTMAISILLSNYSLCGIGISKAIAEDAITPEIVVEIENEKYVQHKDSQTVAIQSKLNIYPDYQGNTYMPTKKVQIGINLPSINGHLPEKAMLVEASTKSTTGEELNKNINQNYDSGSGLLAIFYENIPNQENNIYSQYIEGAKDELKIIYTYPAETYTGNDEEIELNYTLNTIMDFQFENRTITAKLNQENKLTEKENKGDIATFNITKLEENIYKGFMYSNVQNKTNYDIEYTTVSTFAVLNSVLTDEITMTLEESIFVLNDSEETEVSSNGNIEYKTTQISRYEFDKVIGQVGSIEFYSNDKLITCVKYLEIEDTKKLAIIDLDGRINLLDDTEELIDITYPRNITNLKIKVSNPNAEGFIHFENRNVIKASNDYGCDIEKIEKIRTKTLINENVIVNDLLLLEPETKVNLSLSNVNFSTLQNSSTTLTIKLDDTNSSAKLFDNPILTVIMPEGLVWADISSPRIINGNGLEIKNAMTDNEQRAIIIELSGKQTSYDINSVSGGVSIVMDLENIDFDNTMPTHTDKIEVICTKNTQKTRTVEAKTALDVNIVSKPGLLILSEFKNYNSKGETVKKADTETTVVEIEHNSQEREITQVIDLVNNYDENITEVQIVGKIGYSNNELTSTFDTNLTRAIQLNINNAKVYYSENKDAGYDDNSWTEEFTNSAKMYKVVLNNNELAKMETIKITSNLKLNENIGYNQTSYIAYDISYKYNDDTIKNELITGMVTEEKIIEPEIKQIQVSLDTEWGNEKTEYKTGEIVEYYVRVNNISDNKLEDLLLEFEIPENMEYIDGGLGEHEKYGKYNVGSPKGTLNENVFKYTINSIEPGEQQLILVSCKVKKMSSTTSATINAKAIVRMNEENYQSNITTITTDQAEYNIVLTSNIEEGKILKKDDIVIYTIKVTNTGKIGSINVKDYIPEQLQVVKLDYNIDGEELESINTSIQNINLTSVEIGKNKTLIINITAKVLEVETDKKEILTIENVATLAADGYEKTSNTVELKMETEEKETYIRDEIIGGNDEYEEVIPDDNLGDIHPGDNVESGNDDKPEDNKPEEEKPEGDKPEDNKPEEEKPEDNKPEDTKPEEEKPEDNKSEEEKPKEMYSISGIAWLDSDKNGKRDENEKLLNNVKVMLVDKNIGNFALDSNSNRITTITNQEGRYEFTNIPKGSYIVLFEFDTNTYTVTTYQKDGVDEKLNSNVILSPVTIDGNKKNVGLTSDILLDANKENIDIGLVENPIFDLSLNKQITNITVKNKKGTESTDYEEGDIAKVDLVAKYMNGAEVIVTYKFTIENIGEVTGYVNSLVDEIPEGLEFSAEQNKKWHKGSDGKLYTTALSETPIKPGEKTEIELILTKTMTEESTGFFPGNAELQKISNLENILEKENALENNKSSAILVISIKTGTIILYTGLIIMCLGIIGFGTYTIKKKILDKEI